MNKYENVMVNMMIKMHFWLPINLHYKEWKTGLNPISVWSSLVTLKTLPFIGKNPEGEAWEDKGSKRSLYLHQQAANPRPKPRIRGLLVEIREAFHSSPSGVLPIKDRVLYWKRDQNLVLVFLFFI